MRAAEILAAGVLAAGALGLVLSEQTVQTGMPSGQTVSLPIAMYHSVTDEGKSPGEYVIPVKQFECDLRYLSDAGFHTVTVSDVIAFVQDGTPLPDRPVMLTLDDGYYNNYANVYPLLERYDMRAVLSPVGTLTEQFTEAAEEPHENWSYCTASQLWEMADSGRVEMQNHSYDFHELAPRRGCLRKSGESEDTYREIFLRDTARVQELFSCIGIPKPVCYTYPYGACNAETEQLVREAGFSASLGCEEGINVLTVGNTDCLFRMKRYNRDGRRSTEDFWSAIQEAIP